jgi:hypothetical protein
MDSGIAAVLGATIASAGGGVVALASGRSTRSQARAQMAAVHAQWLLDNRRRSYHDLVSTAWTFENAWWELGDALDRTREIDALYIRVVRLYADLGSADGAVQIVGPLSVAQAGRSLIKHFRDVDKHGTRWYRSFNTKIDVQARNDFWNQHAGCREQIELFWTSARRALETSEPQA